MPLKTQYNCLLQNYAIIISQLESFFERYPEAGAGESGRATCINAIKENIQWVDSNIDEISTWFDTNTP